MVRISCTREAAAPETSPITLEASASRTKAASRLPITDEWGHDRPNHHRHRTRNRSAEPHHKGNPPLDEGTSIYDLYADRAARRGDDILYTYKDGNEWIDRTANEFLAETRAIAKGLMKYGLKKGDGVAFMCRTCYEWNLTDAAIMAVGGVLATIYDTDSAEQIRNIVNNSDARLLIVQDTDMREKADGAIEECPVAGAYHHHQYRRPGRAQGLRRQA